MIGMSVKSRTYLFVIEIGFVLFIIALAGTAHIY
jgi:hypothetical protein